MRKLEKVTMAGHGTVYPFADRDVEVGQELPRSCMVVVGICHFTEMRRVAITVQSPTGEEMIYEYPDQLWIFVSKKEAEKDVSKEVHLAPPSDTGKNTAHHDRRRDKGGVDRKGGRGVRGDSDPSRQGGK